MPTGRRLTSLATIIAMGAIVGALACSSDAAVAPGNSVSDSEIDQTVASDAGESFADNVAQYQENESFEENMIGGASTFMAGRSGIGAGINSRTVTCGGPDSSGWYSCIAYTSRGLTITRQVRFWSGGSYALGWGTGSVIDSTNHRWTKTGSFESAVKPGKMFSINVSAAASMVVTHSTPALHTWTGAASVHDSSTYAVNHVTRVFAYTAADTAAALTFTMPRSANPYPASGSISRNLTLHVTAGSFDKTVTRFAKVTFDGSTVAVLQVGALTCSLDLVTGVVSGCH
ncbi:MAG: hypothetical protein ABI446_09775 [Gemmatimonadaceae bacterium]